MTMPDESIIVVKGLKKSFKKLQVLKGIDFSVKKGSILALLGPNGAGKTTTVRILSTLLKPDEGSVNVNGYDVVHDADKVRGAIGLTGQYAAVDEYLTGEENLEMMGRLYRLSKKDTKQRTQELLEQLDLIDAAKRPVKTYSGGMRRRLDLACSLMASPPVIFLDEPTTGLDPPSRLTMWELIQKLVAEGATILLTTQHMEEADKLADRIMVIDNGVVIAEGTPDELKKRIGSEHLKIVIADGKKIEAAKKAIGVKDIRTDAKRRTLSLTIDGGAKHLKQILSRLERAKIKVEDVSLHKPTLDDVFLTLTGHTTGQPMGENENE